MKFHLFLLSLVLFARLSYAQAPEKFSFQGVARNAAGKLVAGRDVSIRVSIRPETALGNPVYQEAHTAKTNANGIFNIQVGGGAGLSGQFSGIDWKLGKYFLQLEMDIDGGSNYTDLGATQLLSVPYALHAAEAVEAGNALHSMIADEAGRWKNNEPIVQEGLINSDKQLPPFESHPSKALLIWYPRKAAFRVGVDFLGAWQDSNIGTYSFASGVSTLASGSHSVAMGNKSNAFGNDAVAIGFRADAYGNDAVAIGSSVSSTGQNSVALGTFIMNRGRGAAVVGNDLNNKAQYAAVLGVANDSSDLASGEENPLDRLLQVGNGRHNKTRSNALTILRNGNVGIGNNVLAPTHILDVGSRIRLRSNEGANTAGLFLDNLNNVPYCFIGGVNDSEAGFYFEEGTAWRFNVHKNGSAWLAGTLTQNSDIRLKEYLKPLSRSLGKLYDLKGYHYQWKDKTRSQGLQTGLIAQEVETVFPELVETDKDGFKSVNYIGLIPHLLEAVKELKDENARMQEQIDASSQQSSIIQSQTDTTASMTEHNAANFVALLVIVIICLYMAVPKHRGI